MNIFSFQDNIKQLKLYAHIFDEELKIIVQNKWVFDLPCDGMVTLKMTGDKVLDPILVVNQKEYLGEDDPVYRSGVAYFLRKMWGIY